MKFGSYCDGYPLRWQSVAMASVAMLCRLTVGLSDSMMAVAVNAAVDVCNWAADWHMSAVSNTHQ